jgi:hypothetical protein
MNLGIQTDLEQGPEQTVPERREQPSVPRETGDEIQVTEEEIWAMLGRERPTGAVSPEPQEPINFEVARERYTDKEEREWSM